MDETITVSLKCLFCGVPLTAEADREFELEDLIDCAECGESNLYESLVDVAVETAGGEVAEQLESQLAETLGKAFK